MSFKKLTPNMLNDGDELWHNFRSKCGSSKYAGNFAKTPQMVTLVCPVNKTLTRSMKANSMSLKP